MRLCYPGKLHLKGNVIQYIKPTFGYIMFVFVIKSTTTVVPLSALRGGGGGGAYILIFKIGFSPRKSSPKMANTINSRSTILCTTKQKATHQQIKPQ